MSGVGSPGCGNRTGGPGGQGGLPCRSLEDRSDDGDICYGWTGSSCDMSDRKQQDASPGRQCKDPSDQHAPPLQCGSPGSDKVRACTTICCSVRQSSSTPPPLLPRKLRENQFLGTSSVFSRPELCDRTPSATARRSSGGRDPSTVRNSQRIGNLWTGESSHPVEMNWLSAAT